MHDIIAHQTEIQQMTSMSNFDAFMNAIWVKEDRGQRRFERQLCSSSFEPTPLPEGCFSLRKNHDDAEEEDDNCAGLDDVSSLVTLFPDFTSSEPIADHCSDDFFDDVPSCSQTIRQKQCQKKQRDCWIVDPAGATSKVGICGFHLPCEEQIYDDTGTNESETIDEAENPSASRRWQERYNELVTYKQRFGNCCVPSQWAENPPLAQWVKRQRYQLKLKNEGHHSTMSTERKMALDKLGFTWDPHTAFWEERLEELERFREENGHANVPTKYPQNPQLAIWAKCQRRQMKIYVTQGPSKSNMTPDRIEKLNRLGFVFNPRGLKRKSTPSSLPDLRNMLIKSSSKSLQNNVLTPKQKGALVSSTRSVSYLSL